MPMMVRDGSGQTSNINKPSPVSQELAETSEAVDQPKAGQQLPEHVVKLLSAMNMSKFGQAQFFSNHAGLQLCGSSVFFVDSPATSELKAPHNAAETAEAVQSPEAGPQLPEHLFKICVGHPGT